MYRNRLPASKIEQFRNLIWHYYRASGRPFPWRGVDDPYKVVVSEIMLQQTQTHRVIPKYEAFIEAFPNFEMLAAASLGDVLTAWQGLGYNRRGKFLREIACKVMEDYAGKLPNEPSVLVGFPGIGKATASSICAFAFNKPTIFIETNIRAVFIHSFFPAHDTVHDREIEPLVAATIDEDNSREWYYALMDYGVMLKQKHGNPCKRSKHHAVQSKFEGSDRQIRGAIVRLLTSGVGKNFSLSALNVALKNDERIPKIVRQLCDEGMIQNEGSEFTIL